MSDYRDVLRKRFGEKISNIIYSYSVTSDILRMRTNKPWNGWVLSFELQCEDTVGTEIYFYINLY